MIYSTFRRICPKRNRTPASVCASPLSQRRPGAGRSTCPLQPKHALGKGTSGGYTDIPPSYGYTILSALARPTRAAARQSPPRARTVFATPSPHPGFGVWGLGSAPAIRAPAAHLHSGQANNPPALRQAALRSRRT